MRSVLLAVLLAQGAAFAALKGMGNLFYGAWFGLLVMGDHPHTLVHVLTDLCVLPAVDAVCSARSRGHDHDTVGGLLVHTHLR